MIKGIGPHFAKRLVKTFGEAVFDVIEKAPERLREVEGIGQIRLQRITAGWADQKAIREIMVFLQSHGIGTSRSVRIFKTYGADAIPLVKGNPYRLARDIRGIGFKTADQLAQRLGIPKDSMLRARAGISYALMEAVADGHCALPGPLPAVPARGPPPIAPRPTAAPLLDQSEATAEFRLAAAG